jgi:hypothetical protein
LRPVEIITWIKLENKYIVDFVGSPDAAVDAEKCKEI